MGLSNWIEVRNSRWNGDIVDTGDVQANAKTLSLLDQIGMQGVLDQLMAKLEHFDRVYLSFDYDALDGSTFRACATPNVGGLSAREAVHLVHTLAANPKFVGADFVEYLPELDPQSVSKELMVKLIDAVWGVRG